MSNISTAVPVEIECYEDENENTIGWNDSYYVNGTVFINVQFVSGTNTWTSGESTYDFAIITDSKYAPKLGSCSLSCSITNYNKSGTVSGGIFLRTTGDFRIIMTGEISSGNLYVSGSYYVG